MGLEIADEGVDLVGRDHHRRLGLDDRTIVCRVQRDKLLDRHFGKLRRQLDVDVDGLGDRREIGPVGNAADIEIGKDVGVAENVLQRLQFGNVMPCFLGHRQAQIVGRQTIRAVLVDRLADGAFAPVVRGQREMPVAVQIVDVLQVIECRRGRSNDVTAFVNPPVLFELVLPAGCRNELPQAGSMATRVGGRIVGALDHRQKGKLHRHATLVEFLDDVMQVTTAALDHAAQRFGMIQIPLLMMQDQWAVEVGHRKALAHTVEDFLWLSGQIDGLGKRLRCGQLDHRQDPFGVQLPSCGTSLR